MRITPKKGKSKSASKAKEKIEVPMRGKRSILFSSSESGDEIFSIRERFESVNFVDEEEISTSSHNRSIRATSIRGRPRIVPSYLEDELGSADEFEDVPPVVRVSPRPKLSSLTPRKKNTPRKKTPKIRNLFEESDEEVVDIDDDSSVADLTDDIGAFSPLDRQESISSIKQAFLEDLEMEENSPESENDSDASETASGLKSQIQNTRVTSSTLNSASNPFRSILAKVREDVKTLVGSGDEFSDDSENAFEEVCTKGKPRIQTAVSVNENNTSSVEPTKSEGFSEIHESFSSRNETPISQKSSENPVHGAMGGLILDSDSDESGFGAFKTVVRDVMFNTSKLSQSQEQLSDSENFSFL